jgi:hypothetical protein
MPKALVITRADHLAVELREAAARSNDADATRRMLALALDFPPAVKHREFRLQALEPNVFAGSSPTVVNHSTVLAPMPRSGIPDDAYARRSAARQVETKGCRRQSNKGMTLTHVAAGLQRSGSNVVCRCKRIHATCRSLSETPRRARLEARADPRDAVTSNNVERYRQNGE